MNADGTEPRMLARDGAQPSWSPDGAKLAFERAVRHLRHERGRGRTAEPHARRGSSRELACLVARAEIESFAPHVSVVLAQQTRVRCAARACGCSSTHADRELLRQSSNRK